MVRYYRLYANAYRGKKKKLNRPLSFVSQGIHRIGCSRFDGLEADGQQGNGQGRQTGEDKNPDTQINPVGKILQPLVH